MTYPHTATIQRTAKVGTMYSFAEVGTTNCFLQPLDSVAAESYGIQFVKGSSCYVPYTTDVRVGDRLIIDGGTYGVKGMRSHSYGTLTHRKLALEEV